MAFFTDSSIFPHDVDDMFFNSAASSVHTELTSSLPFADVDQYFSSTGEISYSPPSIADNAFIFGDPMFHSDFAPDLSNDFLLMNLHSPSFDSVSEPSEAFGPYSASANLPHVESTDEDAEFDLDPEYDNGVDGDCMKNDSEPVNAPNAPQASSPSSEYRDCSPSTCSSHSCTVVDSEDDGPNPNAESSSDTCCSDNDGSDYDEPVAGSRKRARTSKSDEKSTSQSPKSKRGKKANFKESKERYPFHDVCVKVRCMEKTCDIVLWSINKAVDHFHEVHGPEDSVRCAYSDCNDTARNVGNMRRHFLSAKHQPDHHFRCNTCGTPFTRTDAMRRHVRKKKGRCKDGPVRKVTVRKAPAQKAKV
ncbi:hypothetical protein EDD18DRAFT_270761 [Armillaria luteobubalina]|uniref:C2H2-type domain-containing protein n=1 Tax=Armillaria luteobubalina TaxID=153913 RepID=A0AA39UW31_9AGAR|nr:hypothetical protein EDD18DRAFT_270761 [Armillaria luteobubalina]